MVYLALQLAQGVCLCIYYMVYLALQLAQGVCFCICGIFMMLFVSDMIDLGGLVSPCTISYGGYIIWVCLLWGVHNLGLSVMGGT